MGAPGVGGAASSLAEVVDGTPAPAVPLDRDLLTGWLRRTVALPTGQR